MKHLPPKHNYQVLIDSYLISEGIKHMISVIDTNDIILAAHLTKKESNHPVSSNADKANNITIIGKKHNQH